MKLHHALFLGLLIGLTTSSLVGCGTTTHCDSSCTGCCDSTGACVLGNTNASCGFGGVTCASCTVTQQCGNGSCIPLSTGGGSGGSVGGGTGGGSTGGGTGGGATGGGTGGGATGGGTGGGATGGGTGGGATGGGTGGGATGGGTGGGATGGGTGGGATGGGTGGGSPDAGLVCGSAGVCPASTVCCLDQAPDGGPSFSCQTSCPNQVMCSSPANCPVSSNFCCATIIVDGGVPPSCNYASITTACATSCTTVLPTSCTATATVRLCASSADCASDPTNGACCALPGLGTFCINGTIASYIGASCVP